MSDVKFCMIENKAIKFRFIGTSKKGAAHWAREMFKRIKKNRSISNLGILLTIYDTDSFIVSELKENFEEITISEVSEKYKACYNSHYENLSEILKQKIINYAIKNKIVCEKCEKLRTAEDIFTGKGQSFYPRCGICRRGTIDKDETASEKSPEIESVIENEIKEVKQSILDLSPSKIKLENDEFSFANTEILIEMEYTDSKEDICIPVEDKLAIFVKKLEAHYGLNSSLLYDKKLEKFMIKPIIEDKDFDIKILKGKRYAIKFLLKIGKIVQKKILFTIPNIIEISIKRL